GAAHRRVCELHEVGGTQRELGHRLDARIGNGRIVAVRVGPAEHVVHVSPGMVVAVDGLPQLDDVGRRGSQVAEIVGGGVDGVGGVVYVGDEVTWSWGLEAVPGRR